MQVKILGTRGKIEAKAIKHSKHSGILIDDKILLDVGEKEYLKYNPSCIFFTHLHPDHAWFIETNKIFETNALTYVPEKNPLIQKYILMDGPVDFEEYRVTPVPTIHSIKVKSQGYIVEKAGVKIFYSADMVWIEKQYLHLLENTDLVITDGSFIRKGGAIRRKDNQVFGHNGIPDLVRFFKRFTKRIVFVHFGTWFMEDVAASRKKIKALEEEELTIEVGYDGMILSVE